MLSALRGQCDLEDSMLVFPRDYLTTTNRSFPDCVALGLLMNLRSHCYVAGGSNLSGMLKFTDVAMETDTFSVGGQAVVDEKKG